uniref:Uncharacterized protein n=1 Tax=Micrurus surinamensis TaxID=129470 RepID=A0A2D4Q4D4_MICSU
MAGTGRHLESDCFNLDYITHPDRCTYEWKRELAILKLSNIPGFLEYKSRLKSCKLLVFNMSFHIFGKSIETGKFGVKCVRCWGCPPLIFKNVCFYKCDILFTIFQPKFHNGIKL